MTEAGVDADAGKERQAPVPVCGFESEAARWFCGSGEGLGVSVYSKVSSLSSPWDRCGPSATLNFA